MTAKKTEKELKYVAEAMHKFGIGDDPDWLAIILFVRNLLGHLSVYSDEKKAEIQQEVFGELSKKDFSGDQFKNVVAMLDMFIMQTIGAMELEEALAEEKRSAVQLLNEMNAVIVSLQGNSERQGRKLNDFKQKTVDVIESDKERSVIVAKVRSIFQELITEFREESRELQDRARALEHTANFDPLLTTMHNRRSLDGYLKEVVTAQSEESLPLSLIMIDVDFFKKVNDTYGHQTGDDLLKVLGRIVTAHAMQHQAFPARYGGRGAGRGHEPGAQVHCRAVRRGHPRGGGELRFPGAHRGQAVGRAHPLHHLGRGGPVASRLGRGPAGGRGRRRPVRGQEHRTQQGGQPPTSR